MILVRRIALPLRALLVLAFAAMLMLQTLSLPGEFRDDARHDRIDQLQRWGFTIVAAIALVCLQVIIVCTWKLLTRVLDDEIFSPASLRLVDVILGAMATGWTVVAAAFLISALWWDDPGAPLAVMVLLIAGATVGLLMLVLRALLEQATRLRTDLEGVI